MTGVCGAGFGVWISNVSLNRCRRPRAGYQSWAPPRSLMRLVPCVPSEVFLVLAVCELAKVAVGILHLGMFSIPRSAPFCAPTEHAHCVLYLVVFPLPISNVVSSSKFDLFMLLSLAVVPRFARWGQREGRPGLLDEFLRCLAAMVATRCFRPGGPSQARPRGKLGQQQ